jgi:hypothetical protein
MLEKLSKKSGKTGAQEVAGIRFTRDLEPYRYSKIGYLLMLLENYEKGQMPFPGCITEQPAQIMEIFSLLQTLKQERLAKLQKESSSNGRHKHSNKPGARRQGSTKGPN